MVAAKPSQHRWRQFSLRVMLGPTYTRARRGQFGGVSLCVTVVCFIVAASVVSGVLRLFGRSPRSRLTDRDPEQDVIQNAYAKWAPIYDLVCRLLLEKKN